MINVAIIGGTGYGAIELVRLLHTHPHARLVAIISHSQAGKPLADSYPSVNDIIKMDFDALDIDALANLAEVVFLATPSGVSTAITPKLMDKGIKCIDLSGDFRLSADEYATWYKHDPAPQAYLDKAVYGLAEIFTNDIKSAKLIANAGCYPTATLLGILPAVQHKLIDPNRLIIDGKSGVSGAGRGVSLGNLYAEINESVKAYKLGTHQHIPEIEGVLSQVYGDKVTISFTTHLIPMTRGIMCSIHADLTAPISTEQVIEIYQEFYKNQPFVRIRPAGVLPATKEVMGSNFCDIGIYADPRTNRLSVISVIDNLVKGASGQAIQNFNLMHGFDVKTGLWALPIYP